MLFVALKFCCPKAAEFVKGVIEMIWKNSITAFRNTNSVAPTSSVFVLQFITLPFFNMWLNHYSMSPNPYSLVCGEVEHVVLDGDDSFSDDILHNWMLPFTHQVWNEVLSISVGLLVFVQVQSVLNDTQPYTDINAGQDGNSKTITEH